MIFSRPSHLHDTTLPGAGMPISKFLRRLIWLCVLPLLLLAAWLALNSLLSKEEQRRQEASNLAHNFAATIDHYLSARIGGLNVLAVSPLVDDPARWKELYQEAQGFRESFDSHVVFADVGDPMRMLFNTRVPFGTKLPLLPRPKGQAAAPLALATGKPAVGDTFFGTIAKKPLVAIAVPALRDGKPAFLMLTIFSARQFQQQLDKVALPEGWSLAIVDGRGETIAHRGPPMPKEDQDSKGVEQFIAKSSVSPWSVVLKIPGRVYLAPLVSTAVALGVAILVATLAALLGGMLAGRRLGREVAGLAKMPAPETLPKILEVAEVRHLLDEASAQRAIIADTLAESEKQFRQLFREAPMAMCFVGEDGTMLALNERFVSIFGYSQADIPTISEWWQYAYPDPDYRVRAMKEWDASLKRAERNGMDVEGGEYRVTCKDGSERIMLISGIVLKEGLLSNFYDITARKEAEAALKASEAALKQAQHMAGIGNWEWDIQSGRHTWSEEIFRIYGRDPALPPAVYPEVQKYFTPKSWARLSEVVEKALAEGVPYECDAEVMHPDGGRRWITARGKAIRNDSGQNPAAARNRAGHHRAQTGGRGNSTTQ